MWPHLLRIHINIIFSFTLISYERSLTCRSSCLSCEGMCIYFLPCVLRVPTISFHYHVLLPVSTSRLCHLKSCFFDILVKIANMTFYGNPTVGRSAVPYVHTDGRTDMTGLILALHICSAKATERTARETKKVDEV